jgi:hypothetical protein
MEGDGTLLSQDEILKRAGEIWNRRLTAFLKDVATDLTDLGGVEDESWKATVESIRQLTLALLGKSLAKHAIHLRRDPSSWNGFVHDNYARVFAQIVELLITDETDSSGTSSLHFVLILSPDKGRRNASS